MCDAPCEIYKEKADVEGDGTNRIRSHLGLLELPADMPPL